MKRYIFLAGPFCVILVICLSFFYPTILNGKIPAPTDTLMGLYWPWRDLTAPTNPSGIPFKIFLITDPVRQMIPWKKLVIDSFKDKELPKWNPYNFSGTPLNANMQSAIWYPINALFFLFSFQTAWSLVIIAQPILASIFCYLFLRHHAISQWVSVASSISWAFCGFAIAWLTWGTVFHTAIWLPLILLAIDKIRENAKKKSLIVWSCVFFISVISTMVAGHPQVALYVLLFSLAYWIIDRKRFGRFLPTICIIIGVTALLYIPFFQFLLESSRVTGEQLYLQAGWFLPWQHVIQFIVPDFFGNPSTLNYWGVWNYGEFIGYIGILPLLAAMYAIIVRRDRFTFFLGVVLGTSLVFMLPTFIAKIPYLMQIPIFSSLQPTRLMVLVDFSLVILSALGLEAFLRKPTRKILIPISIVGIVLMGAWIFVLTSALEHIAITKRNLIVPSGLWVISLALLMTPLYLQRMKKGVIFLMATVIIIDLFRFGWKFTPFTSKEFFFPNTDVIQFLQNQEKPFRIMSMNDTVMPPNTNVYYRLESIEGYDPIYNGRYEEFIAALNRKSPNISPPFGFNRIVRATTIDSPLLSLLNVRYILSIDEINSSTVELMYQSGQVKVYWNKLALPRLYPVESIRNAQSKQQVIDLLYSPEFNAKKTAIVETDVFIKPQQLENDEIIAITFYKNSILKAKSHFQFERFVVIGNMYDPNWKITIDESRVSMYRTNYLFMGIVVPAGDHIIKLTYD